jgi:hypothetical protein
MIEDDGVPFPTNVALVFISTIAMSITSTLVDD